MTYTEPDIDAASIDLDAVKSFQPRHQPGRIEDAPKRPSGHRIYCFACGGIYETIEEYWLDDDCPDHGEAYGVDPA